MMLQIFKCFLGLPWYTRYPLLVMSPFAVIWTFFLIMTIPVMIKLFIVDVPRAMPILKGRVKKSNPGLLLNDPDNDSDLLTPRAE